MRLDPNNAERLVWSRLRRRQLGERFRRQEPIGPFVADFVCVARSLVIEVDGESHGDPAADRARDRDMAALGFTVLRFWNDEVYSDLDAVVETIAEHLGGR